MIDNNRAARNLFLYLVEKYGNEWEHAHDFVNHVSKFLERERLAKKNKNFDSLRGIENEATESLKNCLPKGEQAQVTAKVICLYCATEEVPWTDTYGNVARTIADWAIEEGKLDFDFFELCRAMRRTIPPGMLKHDIRKFHEEADKQLEKLRTMRVEGAML